MVITSNMKAKEAKIKNLTPKEYLEMIRSSLKLVSAILSSGRSSKTMKNVFYFI